MIVIVSMRVAVTVRMVMLKHLSAILMNARATARVVEVLMAAAIGASLGFKRR